MDHIAIPTTPYLKIVSIESILKQVLFICINIDLKKEEFSNLSIFCRLLLVEGILSELVK